jgi:4-hydroxy-4-methyl-2-oxoglutarate aldolase
VVYVNPERPPILPPQVIEAYKAISPSTVGHMTDVGFLKGLRPLKAGKLVGRAITVRIPHLDSCAVHIAASHLEAGDVLVVDMSGDIERASVGGIVSYAVQARRAAGIIVDGCITDVDEVANLNLMVYSRGVSPLTTRNLGIEGEINVPVSIGGAVVLPGDLIFGDVNGVMTLRGSHLLELAQEARIKEEGELDMKRRLDEGELLMNLSGASKYLK